MKPADIVQKMMDHDAFSQWLGIKVEEISAGSCHLSMQVRAEMLNGFGIAHGGISYALADSALAFASNAHGMQALSIDTSIQHIEALKEGAVLHAHAREESLKNKFAVYTVEIKSAEKLIALFKGTVYRTQKNWEP
ncbi:MAG: hotdog fold thioesterase [Bacteroidia bacterium]|jgi:acyl-CoA thioesterase